VVFKKILQILSSFCFVRRIGEQSQVGDPEASNHAGLIEQSQHEKTGVPQVRILLVGLGGLFVDRYL
jgi:hypothetical protein